LRWRAAIVTQPRHRLFAFPLDEWNDDWRRPRWSLETGERKNGQDEPFFLWLRAGFEQQPDADLGRSRTMLHGAERRPSNDPLNRGHTIWLFAGCETGARRWRS
jgi:hypothetical protein